MSHTFATIFVQKLCYLIKKQPNSRCLMNTLALQVLKFDILSSRSRIDRGLKAWVLYCYCRRIRTLQCNRC